MKLSSVQSDSIIANEKGILKKNGCGFHFPLSFARENLYYILWADEYQCSSQYAVRRQYLDSYLLMYIKSGRMKIEYDNKFFYAVDGNVIFLDLRKEHAYQAMTDLHIQQYMLNGNATGAYCSFLYSTHGPVFKGNSKLNFSFNTLYHELCSEDVNDHVVSRLIGEIFCTLTVDNPVPVSDSISLAKDYIEQHYAEPITLEDIARKVSLSKFYLSRLFQKETATAPKEYLNHVRLRHAMHKLSSTQNSVESIALDCGFSSSTVFIRAFKKAAGLTPDSFRRYFTGIPMGLEAHE